MAEATADFETGTDTSAVLTTDTGSATAWDAKSAFSGNSIVYDSTHAYDTLSGKFDSTPSAAAACNLAWSTGIGTLTDWYGRIYLYLTAFPSVEFRLVKDLLGSGQQIKVNASGLVVVQDADQAQVFVTTNAVNTNAWTRIEFHCVQSATVGQWEVKLFTSPDSATATETKSSAANRNTGASLTDVGIGLIGGGSAGTVWLDNIVIGATDWPGPAGVTPSATGSTSLAMLGVG